jgi:hypothetical protein
VLSAGCVTSTQPAPPSGPTVSESPASPSPSQSVTSPSATPRSTTTPIFDWSTQVGAIRYATLPSDARGQWVPRALLDNGGVLISLIVNNPNATAEQRAAFVSELARYDPRDGTVKTLVRPSPGAQTIRPIVGGGSVAWIEATEDLRAYGWKIHVTDIHSGSDKIAAIDDGYHPEGVSVLPSIAFDGSQLLFTRVAAVAAEPNWQLHWLRNGTDRVIVTVPRVREQALLSPAFDTQTIVWTENSTFPDAHETVGIFDIGKDAIIKQARTGLSAVYQIILTTSNMYIATGSGVYESDRGLSYEPRRFTPEEAAVDQIAVIGHYLVYRNFDRDATVAAIDLATGSRARLGTNATYGPVGYQQAVLWFERGASPSAGRIAITGS